MKRLRPRDPALWAWVAVALLALVPLEHAVAARFARPASKMEAPEAAKTASPVGTAQAPTVEGTATP